MKQLFLFILPLFFLLSCGKEASHRFSLPRESRSGVLLTGLDSLIDANPDSALSIIDSIIHCPLSIGDKMRLELLRAKAKNKAYVPFRADSLAVMQRVADYYHRKGNANDRMLSLYLLGCAYRDLGSAPRAIETWQLAVEQADTSRADCDLSTLMRIHSQMNELYTRMRLPELAKGEILEAEGLCWKMKDTLNALIFEEKKCGLLFGEGKYEDCIKATERVYKQYLQHGFRDEAALSCVFIVKSYLALGNYEEAKHYLDIYGSYCLAQSDHRKIDGGLAPYYIYKGNYYLGIGKVDSAEYCYRKAMPEMSALHNDVDVYYRLYQIYEQKHQVDSTLKYVRLYSQAKENKFEDLKTQSTIEAKKLYDYSVEQRIAREEKEKISHIKDIGYAFFLIVMAILSALGTFYYKERKQALRLRTQLSNKEDMLDKATSELQKSYEQEKLLKSSLKTAQAEQKEKVRTIASQLKQITKERKKQEHAIQYLNGQINYLRTELNDKEVGSKAQKLKNTEIVTELNDFIAHPQPNKLVTKTQWKRLVQTVNKTHPDFYARMNRHKPLSEENYRVCVFLLLLNLAVKI